MSTQQEVPADTQEIFDLHPDFVTLWHIVGWVGAPLGVMILLAILIYARAGTTIHRSMRSSTISRSMR
jgi:hypothetical protein